MKMKKRLFFYVAMTLLACTASAQLPNTMLKDIAGNAVCTDTLSNNGKPIILDFFATWCKPCNRELDAIAEVFDEWVEETGVRMIIVSNDQAHNTHKVKPLVDNHGWEFGTVLLDPNYEFSKVLGNNSGAMPFTVIVDGDGKIVYRHTGYTDGAETELIEKVRKLTNNP